MQQLDIGQAIKIIKQCIMCVRCNFVVYFQIGDLVEHLAKWKQLPLPAPEQLLSLLY